MPGSLWNLADDFVSFHERFKEFFQLKTKSVFEQSKHYLSGLMQANRRNMERMVEVVPNSDWQSLQNFSSYSPWDYNAVTDQVALDTNARIGGRKDSCLLIDESGISKKGDKSVGVSRQWNGRLGKVDNCQVGVFGALCCKEEVGLIDFRLYLPTNWTNDKDRCLKAGVPEDRLVHLTKPELALEMIAAARKKGIEYKWVGADAFYGNDPKFLRQLDCQDEVFMVDVHSDQPIYLEDPASYIPERSSSRGRTPKRLKTDQCAITVRQWLQRQPQSAWQQVFIRNSTRGPLKAEVLHGMVWLWNGEEQQAHRWHLIIRKESNSKNKYKYSLSNAPLDTPIGRLAYMQGQRYWIEKALQDAKSNAGMADYQVRGWTGWHHHMTMVLLALLFMLETRIKHKDSYELLSTSDIKDLLSKFLPRRDITKEEVIRQMEVRHKQRADSTRSYQKRKNKSD